MTSAAVSPTPIQCCSGSKLGSASFFLGHWTHGATLILCEEWYRARSLTGSAETLNSGGCSTRRRFNAAHQDAHSEDHPDFFFCEKKIIRILMFYIRSFFCTNSAYRFTNSMWQKENQPSKPKEHTWRSDSDTDTLSATRAVGPHRALDGARGTPRPALADLTQEGRSHVGFPWCPCTRVNFFLPLTKFCFTILS